MNLKISKTHVYLDNEEFIENYNVIEEDDNVTIMDDKNVIVFKDTKDKMIIIINSEEHDVVELNVYNNELYIMF